MPTEPVSKFCHQDLPPQQRCCRGETKPDTSDLSKEFDGRRRSSLRRVPTVAIWTLATLAAQDLTHPALANPGVNIAEQPQQNEAGDFVVSEAEEPVTKEATMERSRRAVASPESLNVQEFAPESVQTSPQREQGTQKGVTPTLGNPTLVASNSSIAAPETEVKLERTSRPSEQMLARQSSSALLVASERTIPVFQNYNVAPKTSIAAPETEVILKETPAPTERLPVVESSATSQEAAARILANSQNLTETNLVEPTPQTKGILKPTSGGNLRSVEFSAAPEVASTRMLTDVQSSSARDFQERPISTANALPEPNQYAFAPQESVNSQQTVEEQVVAQAVPKKSCLAYASASQGSVNSRQTSTAVAQRVPSQTCLEVEQLREQLREVEELEIEDDFRASPALSIVIPTGFGADNNTGFISATYQERTRYTDVDDGGLGIGIGLGDAEKAVGVELSYALASFGGSRDFGSGGFNVKVHRQLGNDWAVAAGWNGFLNLGGDNDFEDSLYGVVSKVLRTREDINSLFSRVAITAGVGNGQFRTEEAIAEGRDNINVFGNVAVRVAQPVSLIAEWSGQDLGVGLSIAPFKNIPLVITPALRDIAGAGDGARFVLGAGMAFQF